MTGTRFSRLCGITPRRWCADVRWQVNFESVFVFVHREMKEAVIRSYYLAIILFHEKEGITLLSHHVLIQKVRCLDTDILYPF
jgi:hypothetical protein